MESSSRKINMVIGNPIKQSKSPLLHGEVYKLIGVDAETIPVSDPDIEKLVSKIREGLVGLTAVTMPFKKDIMGLLDEVDSVAQKVGAVNTVINREGKLFGYNTDVDGIRYALRDVPLQNKKVLLVGAGGAAQAVAYVVLEKGGELVYMNRTREKVKEMQKHFPGEHKKAEELRAEEIDVVINSTPVGMFPNIDDLSVPESLLAKHQVVFDLIYNPLETKLLRVAKSKGASIIVGLDMFVAQGVRQIELWTGKEIMHPDILHTLKQSLIS